MITQLIRSVAELAPLRILTLCLALIGISHLFVGGCGGGSSSETPVNTAPTVTAQTFSTPETADNGTAVGKIVATDAENDSLTFSSTDAGLPFLLADDGTVTVSDETTLDYETTPSYTLNFQVSDGTNATTATVTINLEDIESETTDDTLIPTNTANIESVNTDGTQVTFTTPDTFTDSLVPGKILLVPTCSAAPGGLLKRVISKSEVGGRVVLDVEQATLSDAFTELDLQVTDPITFDTLDPASLPFGVTVSDYEVPANAPISPSGVTTIEQETRIFQDVRQHQANSNGSVSVYKRFDIDRTLTTGVELSGSIVFAVDLVVDHNIRLFGASHFDVSLGGEVACELTVTATLAETSIPTLELLGPNGHALGIIQAGPVTIVPTVYIDIDATAGAQITVGGSAAGTMRSGVRWERGSGWNSYSERSLTTTVTNEFREMLSFSAGATATLRVATKMYGVAGPYASLSVGVQANAPGVEDPHDTDPERLDIHIPVSCGVGVEAKLFNWLDVEYGYDFILINPEVYDLGYPSLPISGAINNELPAVLTGSTATVSWSEREFVMPTGSILYWGTSSTAIDTQVVPTLVGGEYTATLQVPATECTVYLKATADDLFSGTVDSPVHTMAVEIPTYSINGFVSGDAIADVVIALSGESSATTTTDGGGNFSISGLTDGNYTVIPMKAGYTFSPADISVTVAGDNVEGTGFTSSVVNFGSDRTIADLGMVLKAIPAGSFLMGSKLASGEMPVHAVRISQNFWMGQTEVTQAQYLAIMNSDPSSFSGNPNFPVEMVSWTNAVAFCQALTTREAASIPSGYAFRLPTDAEWEYCCRAGTTTNFSYGQDDSYANLGTYAWYDGNSGSTLHSVAGKKANPWGLYDMHGNVMEWCNDWYNAHYYDSSPFLDPTGPATGFDRVLRGGQWNNAATYCRSAFRGGNTPTTRADCYGFRVVLAPVLPIP